MRVDKTPGVRLLFSFGRVDKVDQLGECQGLVRSLGRYEIRDSLVPVLVDNTKVNAVLSAAERAHLADVSRDGPELDADDFDLVCVGVGEELTTKVSRMQAPP